MKIILVLFDGLGDRSYKILNHRTPMQAAATPNLDQLARLGSNGLFHATLSGQCLPSETAHYLLFGYELGKFPGRGLLEAVGEGVVFDETDVLCLAHLSGVTWKDSKLILTQGRDDIKASAQEIGELFAAITPHEANGIHFHLQQTRRNDAILVLSGQVSPYVSDSDPIAVGRPIARICPLSDNPEPERARQTAKGLNEYLAHAHNVLSCHELNGVRQGRNLPSANFLATQRCGRRIIQEPFDQRWGMPGMLIASGSLFGGLAHELGLDFVSVSDSDRPDNDIRERIDLALTDNAHDFVHVHTKVPDEAAHKGDPRHKMGVITALDRGLDELVEVVEKRDDLLVVVTADHSTPSVSSLIHSGEPVPLLLVGPNVRRDDVGSFDEVSAAKGCLGFLKGRELMLTIINYANRSSLLGHQLGNSKKAFVPRAYDAFKPTHG